MNKRMIYIPVSGFVKLAIDAIILETSPRELILLGGE